MSYRFAIALAGAFVSTAVPVQAASPDELADIRRQMEQLKQHYETRLKALEARLQQAETLAETNRASLADNSAPSLPSPPPRAAATRSGGLTSNAFNPAISLILQGSVNSYSENPQTYALPGFQLGGETALAAEGLTLDESELTASASVDAWFFAQSTLGLHDDEGGTEIDVEEAYVDPLMLPAGLGARFGRFYSDVGYLNRVHSHAWDFRDMPLAYRAFLGDQYGDDGLRLSWTAPTDTYIVLGAETYAGRQFPAGESTRLLGDVQTAYLKFGGDIGVSHAWSAGLSALRANAHERSGGGHGHGDSDGGAVFSGDSDLYMVYVVYKWAPRGNPRHRNLILQTELFYREEDGDVVFSENLDTALIDYDGDQKGVYAQAVWQFMPRWRTGVRYDWLEADNRLRITDLGGFSDPAEVIAESGFDDDGHNPRRWSLMMDWTPSEFSRLRAQYNRDQSRPSGTDHQWTLQYIMSLGAHGAHEF